MLKQRMLSQNSTDKHWTDGLSSSTKLNLWHHGTIEAVVDRMEAEAADTVAVTVAVSGEAEAEETEAEIVEEEEVINRPGG